MKLVGQGSDSDSESTLEDDEAVLREDTKKEAEAMSNSNSAGTSAGVDHKAWIGVGVVTGLAMVGMY